MLTGAESKVLTSEQTCILCLLRWILQMDPEQSHAETMSPAGNECQEKEESCVLPLSLEMY